MKAPRIKLPRGNIFKPICFGLIALFVALCVILAYQNPYRLSETDMLDSYLTQLLDEINAKGVEHFLAGMDDGGTLDPSRIPQEANLLILDRDNKVLASTSDNYIGETDVLNLMISRYSFNRLDWVYSASRPDMCQWENTRLTLLTDAEGNIKGALRTILSDDAYTMGDDLPRYAEYFPVLDEAYYQDAARYTTAADYDLYGMYWNEPDYNWSNLNGTTEPDRDLWNEPFSAEHEYGGSDLSSPPNKLMAQKVRDYVQWENAQMASAGTMRLVYRGPAWDGTQLVLIYSDSDAMHQALINEQHIWRRIRTTESALVALVLLFILSLACWVYVDAKRRDYRPALWGILTLIGNVVGWIVYMLVRPNDMKAKGCPACHAPTKRNYAFCANCGARLCATCGKCGYHLEPSFHFCPNCGRDIADAASPPPSEQDQPKALDIPESAAP